MLRRILLGLVSLVLAAVVFAAVGLFWAKRAINRIAPPLPTAEQVLAFDADADLPVRLSYVNTGSQPMPRSAVLASGRDPTPKAPYVMSYPSFVLEWADGRIFLIDLGMDPEEAQAFGRPLEWLGASQLVPHGSTATLLGADVARVAGVGFTHEHVDHVEGARDLCLHHPGTIALFQNKLQVEQSNFTTRPGLAILAEVKCLQPQILDGGPLLAVPGFPGLAFFAAGGHTPGSQVWVAHVRSGDAVRTYVFTGDLVNQIDGVRQNLPKPHFYSMLIVPESLKRLEMLRRFLASLERDHGVTLLVSHDQLSLEASGISPR